MSTINTSIYGTEEQWPHFNTSTTSQQYDIRGAYFGNTNFNYNNLRLGVTNGYLSIGSLNIDKSLAVWGVNGNCGLCNVSLEAMFNPDEEGETQEFNLEYEDVPLTTAPATAKPLFPLSNNGVQTGAVTIQPTQSWQLYGQNYTNVPITSFNYTHTVMMCYLEVCSAQNRQDYETGPGVEYVALGNYYKTDELGNYINDINPTTHPAILGGCVVPYYGYPYKVGTSTTYQLRQRLNSSAFSYAMFDSFKDFSYLSTPSAIIKWDKEKAYPKPITNAREYGGIGENIFVFGQTIQLSSYASFKTDVTAAIQQILSSGGTWAFNAKIKNKGDLFYYTVSKSNQAFVAIDYSDMTKEEIYQQFAMLGFWFADTTDGAFRTFLGEEIELHPDVSEDYYNHLFIPEFDANTITTGNYYKALDPKAKEQLNYKWGDPHVDNKYNPEYKPGGDTGEYEKRQKDKGSLSTLYNANNDATGQYIYIMTGNDVKNTQAFLNVFSLRGDTIEEKEQSYKIDWKGQDPGNFVLCCNRFPLAIPTYSATLEQVYIAGNPVGHGAPLYPEDPTYNFDVQAYRSKTTSISITFGRLLIEAYYNDFRDYEPYSNYEIQIPYLGSYHLDPKVWLEHECEVQIHIDLVTCSAMAMILRDSLWYDTVYGNFGAPVPFVTYNNGTYQNAVTNAQANAALSKIGIAQSALGIPKSITGAVQGILNKQPMQASSLTTNFASTGFDIAGSVINAQMAEYNLDHIAPTPTNNGGIGGVTTDWSYLNCKLLISRPQPLKYNSSEYGKTVGFACCETGRLVNYSGYTVCSNSRIENFEGTQTELLEIQNLLNSGIVLP